MLAHAGPTPCVYSVAMASVLVQDPYHPYAVRFIELLHGKYGHGAVCFFTDRRTRVCSGASYAALRAPLVEAVYDVSPDDLAGLADRVRRRHEIVGVVPYAEPTVLAAAELSELLGLGWNDRTTLQRFRDKFAFKEHLRARHRHLRVNGSRLVKTVDDVLPGGRPVFPRYVLKPNDGWGNRDVTYLDASSPRAAVEAALDRATRPLVMEEYVGGVEYFVNGQVDARGESTVFAVFRYGRAEVNGCSVDSETRSVRRSDPAFAVVEAYAREVVRASGLRRSPFHLEVKVDERGPCLVEAGARLAGNENAWVCNRLHGDALDLFDVAAHYYVRSTDYGTIATDWARYDATTAVYVHGVASSRARVHSVEGVREIEALPTFARWVKKPGVGDRIEPTVSSLTVPWCVLLVSEAPLRPGGECPGQVDRDAAAVRRLVRINGRTSLTGRASALLRAARERVERDARWRLERDAPPADGAAAAAAPGASQVAAGLAAIAVDVGVRRAQLAGLLPRAHRVAAAEGELTRARVEQARAMIEWMESFVAAPHPDLGRKGAVCPFVQKAMQLDRLFLAFHDEIDGRSRVALRAILLSYAKRLRERYPPDAADDALASYVIVFPNVPEARLPVLGRVHDETKSHLMQHDVMAAVFYRGCTKGGARNPRFALFANAALPCIVLRHMDLRDIVFLGHNRVAFERYRARYAPRFAEGAVTNEFGYVDMFAEAEKRFPRK